MFSLLKHSFFMYKNYHNVNIIKHKQKINHLSLPILIQACFSIRDLTSGPISLDIKLTHL